MHRLVCEREKLLLKYMTIIMTVMISLNKDIIKILIKSLK